MRVYTLIRSSGKFMNVQTGILINVCYDVRIKVIKTSTVCLVFYMTKTIDSSAEIERVFSCTTLLLHCDISFFSN